MNKKELNMIKIYNPMIGLNSIETGRSSNNFNSDKKSFIDFTKKRRRKNNTTVDNYNSSDINLQE